MQPQRLGSGFARYVVPYAAGLAPALLMVLTWSPEGDLSQFQRALRSNGATVVAAQIFAISVAVKEGLLMSLPRWDWSWPVIAAGAVLVIVATTTALLASLQSVAIIVTAYWLVHALFGLSIAYLCGRHFTAEDVARAYMAGFAVVAALLFFFVLQIPDWNGFDWTYDLPAFNHVRHSGLYLAPVAALGIGVMAVARRRIEWFLAFATASVAIALSLWSGSRGAILAIVGALAVSLLFAPAMRTARSWGGAFASIVLATAAVSQIPPAPHPMLGATRTVEASVGEEVTTGRTQMWGIVLDAIQERPIFGYGEGQMREVAPFSVMVQPHNSILQVTLAWGIVGLLCVLILAAALARRAIAAAPRNDGYFVPAFMGLAAVGILSLVDNSLINPIPGSMFAAFGGIIVSRWSPQSTRPESSCDRPD